MNLGDELKPSRQKNVCFQRLFWRKGKNQYIRYFIKQKFVNLFLKIAFKLVNLFCLDGEIKQILMLKTIIFFLVSKVLNPSRSLF